MEDITESLPCQHFSCLQPLLESGHLTFKDGLVVIIGALSLAQLSQLLVDAAAWDVRLDVEAVALPSVQISQLYHIGLRVVHFLQTTQRGKCSLHRLIHVCLRLTLLC